MSKKVAILQSNYIPWKGYFDIINSVDEFIIYDHVKYTKNDWRNRNRIKTKNGLEWITIPISHQSNQAIMDAKVSYSKWNNKHWKTISQNYSKARFYEEYKDFFGDLYNNKMDSKYLSEINYSFISAINKILGIKTKLTWSTDYTNISGQTENIINLCEQAGADIYLSGPSAKNYIDESIFKENKIELTWMNYDGYKEYNQLYQPFNHAVTVLDLIFNEGNNAINFIKERS